MNQSVETDDLPLFFDPRLTAKDGAVLVFLKKRDLDGAWKKAAPGGKLSEIGYPNYRITSVRALAEAGGKQPPFVVVSSEQF